MFSELFKYGEIKPTKAVVKKPTVFLDGTDEQPNNRLAVWQEQSIAQDAMNLLAEWFETTEDDLGENEGLGDRLYALMVSLADENKDGEISDEEADVINIGLNAVYDYLLTKGVEEENAASLLEGFDNDLAEQIHSFVVEKLPEGEDALFSEMEELVFSDEENEAVLDASVIADSIITDAAYRKVFAVRNGKKLRINKRIAGKVRLSAAQKQAIRKAQRKANTGAAKMRRMKSFKMRRRMGI